MSKYPEYPRFEKTSEENEEEEYGEDESQSEGGDKDDDTEDESQSDEEMSEGEDATSDTDSKQEDSMWTHIKEEAKARHREDHEELVQAYLSSGMDENEASSKAFKKLLPVLQKEARNIYLQH